MARPELKKKKKIGSERKKINVIFLFYIFSIHKHFHSTIFMCTFFVKNKQMNGSFFYLTFCWYIIVYVSLASLLTVCVYVLSSQTHLLYNFNLSFFVVFLLFCNRNTKTETHINGYIYTVHT